MKTFRIISTTCFLAGIIFLSACEKSGLGQGDKVIRFTASAENKGLTKSSYSGDGTITGGLLTWERIDWLTTDEIRVASDNAYIQDPGDGGLSTGIHYADYKLKNIETSNDKKKSQAIMAPYVVNPDGTGSNGLVWKAGATHAFYAVYPCPYTNNNISLGSGDDGTQLGKVTATLPKEQTLKTDNTKTRYVSSTGAIADNSGNIFTTAAAAGEDALTYTVYQPDMDYAFMTAATTGVAANTDSVTLSFNPAYTAFEFCITTQGENLAVTKIELIASGENDYLAGEYSLTAGADFTAATAPTVSVTNTEAKPASKTVSMALGEEGLALTLTTGVSLTLFTIPKVNTGVITLKLTTKDGVVTLPMKSGNNPYTFAPGKKHRINCLKVQDKWVFEAVELGLKWDVDEESLTYANDPIINAGALYHVSGANPWERTAATFAGPLPIVEYFTVFAPANGQWVVTNSDASVVLLSATGATSTVDGETGEQTLTGSINGRVDLTIERQEAAGTADLNFYVKVGTRLYSINTEVTRGGAQVITVPNN